MKIDPRRARAARQVVDEAGDALWRVNATHANRSENLWMLTAGIALEMLGAPRAYTG
jgi:hypothetical protein